MLISLVLFAEALSELTVVKLTGPQKYLMTAKVTFAALLNLYHVPPIQLVLTCILCQDGGHSSRAHNSLFFPF